MNDEGCYCPGMRMPPCSWCESRYLCPGCEDIVGSIDDFEDGQLCEKCEARKLEPADFDAFEVTLVAAVANDPLVTSPFDAHVGSVVGLDERYEREAELLADRPEIVKITRPPISAEWLDRIGGIAMILLVIYFLLR